MLNHKINKCADMQVSFILCPHGLKDLRGKDMSAVCPSVQHSAPWGKKEKKKKVHAQGCVCDISSERAVS